MRQYPTTRFWGPEVIVNADLPTFVPGWAVQNVFLEFLSGSTRVLANPYRDRSGLYGGYAWSAILNETGNDPIRRAAVTYRFPSMEGAETFEVPLILYTPITPVPEPGTLALLGGGLGLLGVAGWRRRRPTLQREG